MPLIVIYNFAFSLVFSGPVVMVAGLRSMGRAKRSPDEPPQKRWAFDRIEDRIALSHDGECTLVRNFVVRGLQPKGPTRLTFFLPAAFPELDGFADATTGKPVAFDYRRKGDQRQISFAVPALEQNATMSFTLSAKSRRPIFADGTDQDLFVYSPAPTDAPVQWLR